MVDVAGRILGRFGGPEAPRRLAAVILVVLVAGLLSPVAGLVVAGLAWLSPRVVERRRDRSRRAAVGDELPEVVDLLALAVEAGLTVALALRQVAHRVPGPVGGELRRVVTEVDRGRRMADALDDLVLPTRLGEPVRGLVAVLVAAERYGSPLGPSLGRLGNEVRATRRRQAEEAARRVPVKLLFPLVACTLPAFALLTVAPLIASALRALRP